VTVSKLPTEGPTLPEAKESVWDREISGGSKPSNLTPAARNAALGKAVEHMLDGGKPHSSDSKVELKRMDQNAPAMLAGLEKMAETEHEADRVMDGIAKATSDGEKAVAGSTSARVERMTARRQV
jgi:hypothetical protein